MLREIGGMRTDTHGRQRRWFQDDYFDLYVWQDDAGNPVAFQLCYDRRHAEGAISWSASAGYSHARVDDGRIAPGVASTPLLIDGPPPPYFRVYRRFLDATHAWSESTLTAFVVTHLRAYRQYLFGSRRKLRRPRIDRVR